MLERSPTRFELEPLAPFMVKGKSMLVEAASVGPGARRAGGSPPTTQLVGREAEMAVLGEAPLGRARARGRVVDLVGEPGIGKSRLVEELLRLAGTCRRTSRGCDQYETETAYWPMRALLRSVLGRRPTRPTTEVLETLRARVERAHPGLLPWMPLSATVLDVECFPTPEVAALAEEFRKARLEDTAAGSSAALPTPRCS